MLASRPTAEDLSIETIWAAYGSQLRRWLSGKLSDPDDVEDLLQEILIRSHQGLAALKAGDKLQSWLFRIARNAVIDFYRRRGRQSFPPEIAIWYESEARSAADELSGCILPFIELLPEATAELLKVIDIEGRSQKQYAEELGISYSALKSRVQRGRQKLRSVFDHCCHFELDRNGNVISYQPRLTDCRQC